MRDANATDDLENLEAKLMDVHRAYGEYRRFPKSVVFVARLCSTPSPAAEGKRPATRSPPSDGNDWFATLGYSMTR